MLKTLRFVPVALIVAAGFTAPACAAQVYGQRGGYYRSFDQYAYDNGYRFGLREGENDARRGRDYSFDRHGEYRDADDGYRRGDGDREFYRRSFRRGFETGYNESFNRFGSYRRSYPAYPTYPSYPTTPIYPDRGIPRAYSPASQNGYRDGFQEGRNDASDRRRYDPIRTKRYRDGDHDYDRSYGPRDEYRREYRVAFEQGYREGYQGGARRY